MKIDTIHGQIITDPYFWLRDQSNKDVLAYIESENEFTSQNMKSNKKLEKTILKELYNLYPREEKKPPYWVNGYWYYKVRKKDNFLLYRSTDTISSAKEFVFDTNKIIKKHKCFDADLYDFSEDNKILAYEVDETGDNFYNMFFMEIAKQNTLNDTIFNVSSLEFCGDNSSVIYVQDDTVTFRSHKVFMHKLGTPNSQDILIYHEQDEEKSINVYKSLSKNFIFIETGTRDENEVWFLINNGQDLKLKRISNLTNGVDLSFDHLDGIFYQFTNESSPNYKLLTNTEGFHPQNGWKEIVPHRDSVILNDYIVLKDYLVLSENHFGEDKIQVINKTTGQKSYLPFEKKNASISVGAYTNHTSNKIYLDVSTNTQPLSEYIYDLDSNSKNLLKKQEYNNYDINNYTDERIWAIAEDGTKIPISVIYKKSTEKSKDTPLYIESYGAYGDGQYPDFNEMYLPLLDRGFIVAYAHVRGGDELGVDWYNKGRQLHKKNTFTDFISCTEHLINLGYTSKKNIVAYGASAGGLLMGAIANMRPDLYKTIILDAPFVDVINTMNDPTLPLTTGEYIEWGNPKEKKYFDYMLSYSPYDNVKKQDYPNMLFLTGMEDEQVGFWEPLKMVAKLRKMKTDENLLLIRVDGTGHYSAGFFGNNDHFAYVYSFIFKTFGIDRSYK